MDSYEYFLLVFDNIFLFTLATGLTLTVYYWVYKRYFISVLDPFIFAVFFSAMAVTVPLFLLFVNQISAKLFSSFLVTQISFFLGFLIFKPIEIHKAKINDQVITSGQEIRFAKWLFLFIGITHISLQLFSYTLVGIPLLAEARLGIYGESGGINNLLKRILDINFKCFIFLTIFFFYYEKKSFAFNMFTWLSVAAVLIFSVLSGSKGAFITFGNAFFIYALYSLRWGDKSLFFTIKKFIYKFGVIAILAAITVIYFSERDANPFLFILYRIGQSGDIYYMAYPNAIIDKIPSMNWFLALFASPLSLLGIIPRSMVPEPIGFLLMKYHNPTIEFRGPNPRINVFSYVYFGIIYSPIYCFIIGMLTSFLRNKLFYLLPKNILGCLLYFLLLNIALNLEPDFYNALAEFINLLSILPIFIFISYYFSIRKNA